MVAKFCERIYKKSKCLKNSFTIESPDFLEYYFSRLHVGLGSLYIYEEDEFMSPKYNTRLPDIETTVKKYKGPKTDGTHIYEESKLMLPHVMTLIVTSDITFLRVDGKHLNDEHAMVLFSLDCKYEVPICSCRAYYEFPIYGIYNPFSYNYGCSSVNIYDELIKCLSNFKKEKVPFGKDQCRMIKVYSETFVDSCIAGRADLLHEISSRKMDCECSAPDYYNYVINYTDNNDVKYSKLSDDNMIIPNGSTNISIQKIEVSSDMIILNNLIDLVEKEKKIIMKDIDDSCAIEPKKIELGELPKLPFVVILKGIYHENATIADLNPCDKPLFEKIIELKREIKFAPAHTRRYIERLVIPVFHFNGENLSPGCWFGMTYLINELEIEIDTRECYTTYNTVYGLLYVT